MDGERITKLVQLGSGNAFLRGAFSKRVEINRLFWTPLASVDISQQRKYMAGVIPLGKVFFLHHPRELTQRVRSRILVQSCG